MVFPRNVSLLSRMVLLDVTFVMHTVSWGICRWWEQVRSTIPLQNRRRRVVFVVQYIRTLSTLDISSLYFRKKEILNIPSGEFSRLTSHPYTQLGLPDFYDQVQRHAKMIRHFTTFTPPHQFFRVSQFNLIIQQKRMLMPIASDSPFGYHTTSMWIFSV